MTTIAPSELIPKLIRGSRSFSGKLAPFVFYETEPGLLEEILGEYVSVLSSDKAGLVAALSSKMTTIIEELDATPPDLVDDVVRLLRSCADVVARVKDAKACDGYRDGDKYVEPCSEALHPAILASVIPVSLHEKRVSASWGAGGEDPLWPEKEKAIDSMADMVRKNDQNYEAYSVFERCRTSVKVFWGTDDDLLRMCSSLRERLAQAVAADGVRAATPIEVAKRVTNREVKLWFLAGLGLKKEIGFDGLSDAIEKSEACKAVMVEVAEFSRTVSEYEGPPDGVPSAEEAKVRLGPAVAAARAELDAGKNP